jgi:NADH pyrophosphatase NudC (nudix superfamily)
VGVEAVVAGKRIKMMQEEMIDLVDEQGKVIATKSRSEILEKKLNNFRLVCVFMMRSDGCILIPRRAATKKIYPNALGLIGGFVRSGETYEQALKREVLEETGFQIHDTQWRLLGIATPWRNSIMGFTHVYQVNIKDTISPIISDEFSEFLWLTPDAIRKKIKAGEQVTTNLRILLSLFY